MSDCFVLYLLLTCMKKKTSGADKFTNNRAGNDPRNLVTIYQNPVNHPVMSSIERSVRKTVEGGQIVNYKVTPIYQGNNLIPSGITIQAQGNGGLNIFQTILNRK